LPLDILVSENIEGNNLNKNVELTENIEQSPNKKIVDIG
jgi:uncharacterized protein YajQ (UPF0234 family)